MALATLVLALGGLVAVNAGIGSAATQPGRQHAYLKKVCPPQLVDPVFVIQNPTDDQTLSDDPAWAPETLEYWVTVGRLGATVPITVKGTTTPVLNVTVKAGKQVRVTAVGAAWHKIYYVHTRATYKGKVKEMAVKQFCQCQTDVEEPATTTTVTVPPTSTTTTTPPTTTTTLQPPVTTTTRRIPPSTTTTIGGG